MKKSTLRAFLSFSVIFLSFSILASQYNLISTITHISQPANISRISQQNNNFIINSNDYKIVSSTSTNTQITSWTELGPKPINNTNGIFTWGTAPFSGRVTAIAVNGSNPSNIYLGGAQGGVWKSMDGGTTWVPLTDNQSSLAIGAITFSPDNKTLYVGTGEPHHSGDSYAGSGILKSTDSGLTWSLLGANYFNKSAISAIAINKTNPNQIFVGTTFGICCNGVVVNNPNGNGVFLSTNNGVTWTKVLNSDPNNGIADLLIDPNNQSIVYTADFNGTLWQSLDAGQNWARVFYYNVAAGPSYYERVAITAPPTLKNIIYVVFISQTANLVGIYKFNATNNSYSTMGTLPALPNDKQSYGPCNNQCDYDLVLKVDPTNANIIYFGGINLYRSNNGGSTWTLLGGSNAGSAIHTDQQYLAIDPTSPSTIYIGNDGGIWKSTNYGTNWINLNTNLGITQFNTITTSPFSTNILLGGTQDNACDSYNNSLVWTIRTAGDGGWAGFEKTNANIWYCNYANMNFQRSINSGKNFSLSTYGINLNDPSRFYAPVGQDPNNPGTLYFGSNHIYKTTNFGSNWSMLSITSSKVFSTIAVAPSNSNIIYAGDTAGMMFVSGNAGGSWISASVTANKISSIAIDPSNASIAYIATTSFDSSYNPIPEIYKTINQGVSWQLISSSGLPSVGINVIKIYPLTNVFYAGMDRGVYYSTDHGQTWVSMGSGLPNVAVFDLAFTINDTLIAATHGRGVWKHSIIPAVILNNVINNNAYKSGTIISLSIISAIGINQILYHWDNLANSTFSVFYNVTLPKGDGSHILTIYVQDNYGNWAKQSFTFITDDTPPVIVITSPTNGTTIRVTMTINGTIYDLSGIALLEYDWDNSNNTTIIKLSDIIIPNLAGVHNLHIYAEDMAGNWAKITYVYTIQSSSNPSISSSPGFEILTIGMAMVIVSSIVIFRRRNYKKF